MEKIKEYFNEFLEIISENGEYAGVALLKGSFFRVDDEENVSIICSGDFAANHIKKDFLERIKSYLKDKCGHDINVEVLVDVNVVNNNEEENTLVTFHTYVKVFGQKLPAVIVMDESIYVILRVQVIPDIEYMKNKDEFIRCVNEMNINYKAVKYYLGADNALYLDMYIPNKNDDLDGELVMDLLNAITVHLEKEYPNWMKLLWN